MADGTTAKADASALYFRVLDLMAEHARKFGSNGLNLIAFAPALYGEIAEMLQNAIQTGVPLTDAGVREAFGMTPIPEGDEV